ncbi:MAG: Gfo/Idh/MocA family oxidoreductase [Actinomycetota bacterium]
MQPHEGAIRWGIAATGKIASAFATAFPAVTDPDASIIAVGSRRPETAAAFASEHGIERAHGSYADLAADATVDAVYVASLQPGHVTDAIRFLDAGKHVLVEKPMALSAVEVDRIASAAAANDRFAMEAMWMRFNPGPVAAVDAVRAGAVGELHRLAIDFSIEVDDDPDHRLRSAEKGGGALLDLGIYPVTLAWWLLGPPTSWTVEGTVAGGVDTRCVIEATWPSASATLTCGLDEAGPLRADLVGSAGELTVAAPFHAADRLVVDGHEARHPAASLHWQVDEVHRCLRAGERESPRNPIATTRAILAWCDEIRSELGVRYPTEGS